jgi:FemAB-related protein (PEP-CTERM system-associated)
VSIVISTPPSPPVVTVRQHAGRDLAGHLPRLEAYVCRTGPAALSRHPAWLTVLQRGLGHVSYCLEAVEGERTVGLLPLAYVRSVLFGKFLVSLPYLNSVGIQADDDATARLLADRAVRLADELGVRYLELRHERSLAHPALADRLTSKAHLRLPLPADVDALWKGLDGKVRNQVRKGRKNNFTVAWGGTDLLPVFYDVFSHAMRDLGTPVYGRALFCAILEQFPDRAELCVVRLRGRPIASGLLLHGWGVTEVPSACSLREFNPTCVNMLTYWHLLERAVQRKQSVFDFGRSTKDGPTYKFKEQWGAAPAAAEWQYYVRSGSVGDVRPENPGYGRLIRLWKRLPVGLTRLIGPPIVRGIP